MKFRKEFEQARRYKGNLFTKTFTLQKDTCEELQKICITNKISLSAMVDVFIKKKLEEIKELNKEGETKT